MKYSLTLMLFLLGCSAATIENPPKTTPTNIERQIANPLNECQCGKYYRMVKYRHDMQFYIQSNDKDVAIQAAKNLVKINKMIDEMEAKGINRKTKKSSFKW